MANKLDLTIAAIEKQFGKNTIMRASEFVNTAEQRVPSGVFSLDIAMGGGIPKGRTLIYKGEFSAGKTSAALLNVGEFQKRCRFCLTEIKRTVDVETGEITETCACGKVAPHVCGYLDVEGTYDPVWASCLGVNNSTLYLVQPEYGEQAVDILEALIRSGELDLLVVDSLAAITPTVEIEATADKQLVGNHARLINRMCRTISSSLNSLGMDNPRKPTVILINQIRDKIGVMYGPTETMPGGRGQGFTSSITVNFANRGRVTHNGAKDGIPVGVTLQAFIEKNKTFPPYQTARFELYHIDDSTKGCRKGEVNNGEQIISYAVQLGLVKKGGSWFSYPADADVPLLKVQGEQAFAVELMRHEQAYTEITGAVMDAVRARFRKRE